MWNILVPVRKEMEERHSHNPELYNTCIEASELIVERVLAVSPSENIKTVEGWVYFDDPSSCSDRGYDPHTWVEWFHQGDTWYLDVTASQFEDYMTNIDETSETAIPLIILSDKRPYCFRHEQPEEEELARNENWEYFNQ